MRLSVKNNMKVKNRERDNFQEKRGKIEKQGGDIFNNGGRQDELKNI
jgi:hypothetical protein